MAAALFLVACVYWPGPLRRTCVVYIPADMTGRRVSLLLKELNIVRSPFLFELWARLTGQTSRAGEYVIEPGANIRTVVHVLHKGVPYLRKVVVPEGFTSMQVVELLRREPMLTGFVDTIPPEGALWPETYTFIRGERREVLLTRMRQAMHDKLAQLWQERPVNFPLKSSQELLILASLVEREAGKSDRSEVASVFLNRLKNRIPLQADATVIYALTRDARLGRPLSRTDLRTKDPYNTHVVIGLPPGPICNPGLAAIQAVLESKESQNLYFVLKPDGDSHAFAQTLDEHNKNVRQWRQAREAVRA